MSKKLRVLFVTRKWPPAIGGMETYSQEITQELSQLVDLSVASLPGRSDGQPPRLGSLVTFVLMQTVRLFRERGLYDIVHFGDLVLYPLAWWNRTLQQTGTNIITVHGLDLLFGNRTGWKPWMYRRFLGWARKHPCVQHFIANSQNTAEICRSAAFVPVTAVPLGVRVPRDTEPGLVKERYLLFVGRLVTRKGASWFAEYVLPALPSDVCFYVVGKVWDQSEEHALRQSSRTKLLGHVPHDALAKLRKAAVAQVMPNLASPDSTDVEGFGIAALEAAAHGIPVIASAVEGLVDAVRHEETGFLVPSGEASKWISQISSILGWNNKRRRQFALSAQRALEKHYSWQRVAADTVKVYEHAIASGQS